jgi:hypothetical protein
MAKLIKEKREVTYVVELTESELDYLRKKTDRAWGESREIKKNKEIRVGLHNFFNDVVAPIHHVSFSPLRPKDEPVDDTTSIPQDDVDALLDMPGDVLYIDRTIIED